MKRWVPFAVVAFAVTACQDASGPAAKSRPTVPTAALIRAANPIPGSYIVVMNDAVANVDAEVDEIGQHYGVSATFRYKDALKGFAGKLSPAAVDALRNDPRVAYIEEDQLAHMVVSPSPQLNPPSWGLDRIDQRPVTLDHSYSYNQTGAGVDAYIIDTGILRTHTEFERRADFGYDAITPNGGTAADGNGHGTHVAGTVGGATYGVAKGVHLIAVRVLDNNGSGSYSQVIAGVDFVTRNHVGPNGAVANMSLGGPTDAALDQAVRNSIIDGVTYAVAAGNDGADASTHSPADVAEAITVAATDINDQLASWSNYGPLIDILAPGVNITSAWNTSITAMNTISGTSMATPHVTGAVALYLETNRMAAPATVVAALRSAGTPINGIRSGTTNLLLYSLFGPPPPPVTKVDVSPPTSTIVVGETVQLTATTTPSGRAITWTSSSPTVATVSATGLVTGKSASPTPVTITATSEGVSGLASVTVNAPPPVTAVSVTPSNSVIQVGQTVQLTATTTPSGRAVTWSSSNTAVATVDANGLVKGVSSSTTPVTITATSETKTATATVTVNPSTVTAITVSPTSATLTVGQTSQLTATTTPANQPVSWSSSAPGIASVSNTGLVRGVTAGTATITATSGGKSATSRITVTAACTNGNCQN